MTQQPQTSSNVDQRLDELLAIAQDPQQQALFPQGEPYRHDGVQGVKWTFPNKQSAQENLKGRTMIQLAPLVYFQPRRGSVKNRATAAS